MYMFILINVLLITDGTKNNIDNPFHKFNI